MYSYTPLNSSKKCTSLQRMIMCLKIYTNHTQIIIHNIRIAHIFMSTFCAADATSLVTQQRCCCEHRGGIECRPYGGANWLINNICFLRKIVRAAISSDCRESDYSCGVCPQIPPTLLLRVCIAIFIVEGARGRYSQPSAKAVRSSTNKGLYQALLLM